MIDPVGGRVLRIDRPTRDLVCLEIACPERIHLVVSCVRSAEGVGLVDERLRGAPVDSFGRLLRKHLVSSRVAAIESDRDGSRIVFSTLDGLHVLECMHDRASSGFALVRPDGTIAASTSPSRGVGTPREPVDPTTLVVRGRTHASAIAHAAADARIRSARRALRTNLEKTKRKLAAIERDASRADRAPAMRHDANLLVTSATDDVPGRSELVVLDYAADPPVSRAIELDPRFGPRTNASRRFHEARRVERGVAIALERAARAREELARLEALGTRLDAEDPSALDAIETLTGGAASAADRLPAKKPAARSSFRAFASERGIPIWVGKSAADNDALTVRIARPHHLFLHVRGRPGSHVIVALERGSVSDEQTLIDAATLAAHFSDARGEAIVEVTVAERRHVRKPRGSAPGSVVVDREKTIRLRFEPKRLARLLGSEREQG